MTVCVLFRQQNFSAYTAGLLHPHRTSRIALRVSHTHIGAFGYHHGSSTPEFQDFHLRGLTAPFLLHPTHINYFSIYDLNHESFIRRCSTHELITHSPRMVNNHTVHPHPTRRDVPVHMNAMMLIHIFHSYTIIFHIIQTSCFSYHAPIPTVLGYPDAYEMQYAISQ